MFPKTTRRTILTASAAGALSAPFVSAKRTFAAAPSIKIHDTRVISHQKHLYHGWPTLARRKNGELLLVCSGSREAHVCPFGRVEFMRSGDQGRTWSWPRTVMDGPIDDRDAGVVETAKGSILVTTFTSLAYEPILNRAAQRKPGESGAWTAARLNNWKSVHNRVSPQQRKAALGVWMIRSTDGGVTWSGRARCQVNSPHGPIQLSDGRLLYAGKRLWEGEPKIEVCHSDDDGQTWNRLATIPTRDGDNYRNYHELHAAETTGGKLIVHIRNHNAKNNRETLQCESSDGGKTWSVPRSIGVWGLPSHLLRLADGRLLMSYGHRRKPFGNQARISSDAGATWSEPISISVDGMGGDLGYPSTVQLTDGSLLTVWYEVMKGSPRSVLRQCHWSLT